MSTSPPLVVPPPNPPHPSANPAVPREVAPRLAAAVAGGGLLVMAALGFAAYAGQGGFVVEDPAATAAALRDQLPAARLVVAAFGVIAVLDVVVAWALGAFIRPWERGLSVLATWCRVAYGAVLLVAAAHLQGAVELAGRTGDGPLDPVVRDVLVAQAVDRFQTTWDLGLALFGVHLVVLGAAVWRSSPVPRWVAALLVLAGAGYLVDAVGTVLVPGYRADVAAWTFVGEVVLMVWLLVRGIRVTTPPPPPAPPR